MDITHEAGKETRNTRILSLVKLLLERTREHRIRWEFTAADGMFQAAFPNYIVQIHQVRSKGERSHLLEVLNEYGNVLEDISDKSLQLLLEQEKSRNPDTSVLAEFLSGSIGEGEGEGETAAYHMLEEIYVNARRIALGSEQAVDNLIRLLGEEE